MSRIAIVTVLTIIAGVSKIERSYQVELGPVSPFTPYAQVTIQDATPPTPTSIVAVDSFNGRDALITWVCPASPLITGFRLERQRQTAPNVWEDLSPVLVTDPTARTYTDPVGVGIFRFRIASLNSRAVGP